MLVISRTRDGRVVIIVPPSDKPTEIDMTIVDIRGDKVRLGFDAPREVNIARSELLEPTPPPSPSPSRSEPEPPGV